MLSSNHHTTLIPIPTRGSISLVVAPHQALEDLTAMLASLALNGRVTLVDGGNIFDGYGLARLIRTHTPDVHQTLSNIRLSRCFTCYQMLTLLRARPDDGTPLVVLDLLATFLDESVAFSRRRGLLVASLASLQRLSVHSPVALWVRPRSFPSGEGTPLLSLVRAVARDIWQIEPTPPVPGQLPLFQEA